MAFKSTLTILTAAVVLVNSTEAYRLLVVFPMTSKSHSILGHGVVNRLLEAGHEVVHITGFPRDKPHPKLKEIAAANILKRLVEKDPKSFEAFKIKQLGRPNFGDSMFFLNFVFDFHKMFLEEKNVVDFLSDPREKFDAVILEWFFSEVNVGIAPIFQCPLIWLGSTEAHWQVLKLVDTIPNPAYNVEMFSSYTPPLSFRERMMELWMLVKKSVMISYLLTPKEKAFYDSYYPNIAAERGVHLPPYEEAVYNGSMLFLNSHPSIGTPFNLPQNAKYIGGFHVDGKIDALPEDLQNIMDDAEHGVIYFSMGSGIRSSDMSDEMKESILELFAKLKQTVIWKFEVDLEDVPENVHLVKWAPQWSILAHPNLKLFITHGGQLSTTEAIHFGVPVIGVPVFGDQHINMDAVARKGFGIKINPAAEITEQLTVAVEKMLMDPSYKQRATELSQIYHDRLMSPGKELVHWVEHVVKTRGAPHLRSPALMVPWYQKMYLDLVILIISLIILTRSVIQRFLLKKEKTRIEGKRLKKK